MGSHGITHGHCSHGPSKVYRAWISMRGRCGDPNHEAYSYYGGRGITVCRRWDISFENFLSDMGLPPTERHSLGRIDNDQGYSPGNCEWQTPAEQSKNTRGNRMVVAFGERKTLMDWSRDSRCSAPYSTVWARIDRHGWSSEIAITKPARKRRQNHNKEHSNA